MKALRSPTLWIGLAAVVALIGGLAMAMVQWRRPAAAGRTPDRERRTAPDTSSDRVIDQAIGPREGSDKTRWVDEVPGLDVSDLDPARQLVFLRHANSERCTCGCGYTLAACRVYDSTCEKSEPRVVALLDSVRSGRITDARGLREPPASR
jgi:hypothetical protein